MNDAPQSERLRGRRLYLCTPDRPDLEQFVSACIDGGVDVVQLRDKHLEPRQLAERARLLQQLCTSREVPFIVNDRPDVALLVGADGVHVGQDDVPPALARDILGQEAIVGRSTHQLSELAEALREPVDYVSVGPVVPTPTKPGRPGTGVSYIEDASALIAESISETHRPMPFFVTGGVTPETVGALVRSGATRFVAVRYLTESLNPREAAERLRRAIETAISMLAHPAGA